MSNELFSSLPYKVADIALADFGRKELDMAEKFVQTVNRHGGKAELIRLPDLGIRGNTHFIMSDLNNAEIAELVNNWLQKQGID